MRQEESTDSLVIAQIRPPSATNTPPVNRIGWMGNLSTRTPKGRLATAIPIMTRDTLRETTTMSAANSLCSTGNMGWVMYMFVNEADTSAKTMN